MVGINAKPIAFLKNHVKNISLLVSFDIYSLSVKKYPMQVGSLVTSHIPLLNFLLIILILT